MTAEIEGGIVVKISEVLLYSFKMSSAEIYDGNDTTIINKIKRMKNLAKALIGVLLITILSSCAGLWVGAQASGMKQDTNSQFPASFSEKKIYLATAISSANVTGYQYGYASTNLGQVADAKKPDVDVMIVFEDIDNALRPIEEINQVNTELKTTLTYVTPEYTVDADKAVVLTSDLDKILYKKYIKDKVSVDDLASRHTVINYISCLLFIIMLAICAYFVVLADQISKVTSVDYGADMVLEDLTAYNSKKPNTKSRASDTTGETAGVEKETDISSVLANEGGIFTGVKDKGDTNV